MAVVQTLYIRLEQEEFSSYEVAMRAENFGGDYRAFDGGGGNVNKAFVAEDGGGGGAFEVIVNHSASANPSGGHGDLLALTTRPGSALSVRPLERAVDVQVSKL